MHDWELDLWLAALFHDAGKVSQRFGGDYRQKHAAMSQDFVRSLSAYLGEERAQRVAQLAGAHHDTPRSRLEKLLHVADKLASLERTAEPRAQMNSDEAALVSVTSRVEFRAERAKERYHPLKPLTGDLQALFPGDDARVQTGQYQQLWNAFVQEVQSLSPFRPIDLHTLLSLIRKYWAFVPSATPWESTAYRTVPDVSLYDHTKVVTAIAACLGKLDEGSLPDSRLDALIAQLRRFAEEGALENLQQIEQNQPPLARFVRWDLGGIQSFIFRIARPEADTSGVARRLRGRSFMVAMLTQAIADWTVRLCEVTPANVLFCGGGVIDLLLPATPQTEEAIRQAHHQVSQYLLEMSGGLLTLQGARVDLWAHDFGNFGDVYTRAAARLGEAKNRRAYGLIQQDPERFFAPEGDVYDICPSCGIVPVEGDRLCEHCQHQQTLGAKLPRTHTLAFVWGDAPRGVERIAFPLMNLQVALLDPAERQQFLQEPPDAPCVLVCLNDPEQFLSTRGEADIGFRFQFVANGVPTRAGELIPFEPMAGLGEGAERLGVLKMDVDYLGAVFGMGVEPPTISRLATLSSAMEAFFGGWLNQLCVQVSRECLPNAPVDPQAGVYYTLYAGGDDLFVLGPWEAVVRLAQKVQDDFRRFVGHNPNLTLSGGLVCVKPKFPVPRFAELAEEALARAKGARHADPLARGDHLCLFDTVVPWQELPELLEFAEDLYRAVQEKQISRGFVYFLLRLHEQFFADPQQPNLLWIPRFHYQLARRVHPDVIQNLRLLERVPRAMPAVRIPVSYVSLKMRED
ncbi:MAG: type III-A CRISPR-associated protein Cas10/Csm1 [Chthonomonadetes bacterium]|nr:type III-A CRISPR-associated protein Cas10/Csm1 [Chthonomonadetes bacterium]